MYIITITEDGIKQLIIKSNKLNNEYLIICILKQIHFQNEKKRVPGDAGIN